ncbi:MAG TPA: hypothetical protein VFT67_16385 [Jatrophihabitantaceae bacterium]|jgi:hypothetical protein|nr:hypothetical protein [Jatrophihabitantaceae bacterium]
MITTLAVELAAKGPTGEAAKSGPWGLAIILILCAACYFLFKSMSKHMRKVREGFPVQDKKSDPPAQQADQTADEAQLRADGNGDDRPAAGDGPAQP